MEAIDILMAEHRVIEQVILAMEKAVSRIQQGQVVRPGFFMDAAEFIRGFADGCHHRKEEGVLFKAMADNGLSAAQGPLSVMLYEHEQGRQFIRGMSMAAKKWQLGDTQAKTVVVENALAYIQLLRTHISKEDQVLFPLANQLIPLSQQQQIVDDFAHIEYEDTGKGTHEKYLALAEGLEQEMN